MDAANWGKLGYLEAEQTEALEALLKSHGDEVEAIRYSVESPRECALRFLRARKFDIEKKGRPRDEHPPCIDEEN